MQLLIVLAGMVLALLAFAFGVIALVRLSVWAEVGLAEFRDEWGGEPRMLTFAPSWWRVCGRGLWRFTVETRQATSVLLRFRSASAGERRIVADSIYGVLLLVLWGMLLHWIAHS